MQIFSVSLLLPIAYLSILIGSLATFSHLYRRRQLHAKLRLAPYFPSHTTRNVYLSLLHLPDHEPSTVDDKGKARKVTVPDSVLRAALLNRACTDIERILEVRTRKPALNQLLQRGVVGDEIWQRLLRAEQELEMEVKDVVSEANALSPGWGAVIFQSAGEMVQNRILREKLDKVSQTKEAEKAAWEQTKEQARKELLGDDAEEKKKKKQEAETEKKQQQQPQQQQQQQQPQSKVTPAVADISNGEVEDENSKVGTDDDAVLVEREAADASSQPTTTSTSTATATATATTTGAATTANTNASNTGSIGRKKNKKKNKGNN